MSQNPSLDSVAAVYELSKWRAGKNLDLVIVNTATVSAAYRLLPKDDDVASVYFCHGLHFDGHTDSIGDKLLARAEELLTHRTDAAVCMNGFDHGFFLDRMPGHRVLRLPAGVGLNADSWIPFIRPSLTSSRPDRPLRIVWMGYFVGRKRPLDAIRVLARLRATPGVGYSVLHAQLEMLGEGPLMDEARALAEQLDLHNAVSFRGHVDPRSSMQHADVLLHTANWEGYCRTLMEAAYIKLPAVSYAVKGCVDVDGTVAVGQPGDITALTNALVAIADGECFEPRRVDASWEAAFETVTAFLLREFGDQTTIDLRDIIELDRRIVDLDLVESQEPEGSSGRG